MNKFLNLNALKRKRANLLLDYNIQCPCEKKLYHESNMRMTTSEQLKFIFF